MPRHQASKRKASEGASQAQAPKSIKRPKTHPDKNKNKKTQTEGRTAETGEQTKKEHR